MKARLIKTENGYGLKDCELIAFVSTVRTEHRHHKLSIKNCQAIERGYDLDELAEEYSTMSIFIDSRATEPPTIKEIEDAEYISEIAFKKGFQKALELMGDKKFNEEDLKTIYNIGWSSAVKWCDGSHDFIDKEEAIQSLQQNEWEVEILMEEVAIGDKYTPEPKPKLDADGCLVLRRI